MLAGLKLLQAWPLCSPQWARQPRKARFAGAMFCCCAAEPAPEVKFPTTTFEEKQAYEPGFVKTTPAAGA